LKASSALSLMGLWPHSLPAQSAIRRVRPSDPGWPSQESWKRLNDSVGGNLLPVDFPLAGCQRDLDGTACKNLFANLANPYWLGDQPGLTESFGWVDAWVTRPSVRAVAATSAGDIAAAVNFARENNLRLVVKGGGHSYQGTSSAPDSLLVWTRHMNHITLHSDFVPHGCTGAAPEPAVTIGAGCVWADAYDAVTTSAGRYVQGGGCMTVGVPGLIQSGGFSSFSKHYGLAAASLLEAEVVTADGRIRTANACQDSDLFWALKGGGGGTFGVVTSVTARVHPLPEFFDYSNFTVRASSDDAYRHLLRDFVAFYRERLFNDRWGEQAHCSPSNRLTFSMVGQGLDPAQARAVWQPFLSLLARSPHAYIIESQPSIGAMPARDWWNPADNPSLVADPRPGAPGSHLWWRGDGAQSGMVLHAYESLWLPASLLADSEQARLAEALFEASRYWEVQLHFNKGLAGASPAVIDAARDTATNPAVLTAFALAIIAGGEAPAYPDVAGHEPHVIQARKSRAAVHQSMSALRAIAPVGGSYVSESDFFESDWQRSFWGSNYPRLAAIKKKYDPQGLFFVHHGVGSENWSADGFTKL